MIKLRAHHGLCLYFYHGKGYSNEFVKNMNKIKEDLEKDPLITIINSCDDICARCPNNLNNKCSSLEKVNRYDSKVLNECKIEPNSVMRYSRFNKLVCDNILEEGKRENICGDCEWSQICIYNKEG